MLGQIPVLTDSSFPQIIPMNPKASIKKSYPSGSFPLNLQSNHEAEIVKVIIPS